MQSIICTKHSLEEYLNDNPLKKNPEKKLISLYIGMISQMKSGKTTKYTRYDKKVSIMRLKDQALVFSDTHIITYYRIVHKTITSAKNQTIRKMDKILTNIIIPKNIVKVKKKNNLQMQNRNIANKIAINYFKSNCNKKRR